MSLRAEAPPAAISCASPITATAWRKEHDCSQTARLCRVHVTLGPCAESLVWKSALGPGDADSARADTHHSRPCWMVNSAKRQDHDQFRGCGSDLPGWGYGMGQGRTSAPMGAQRRLNADFHAAHSPLLLAAPGHCRRAICPGQPVRTRVKTPAIVAPISRPSRHRSLHLHKRPGDDHARIRP
jgi:hypothetical protein